MGRFLKKKLGFIIILIIILVFPISLSNQARLNTRVIITGLAIDKVDDKYEVTAQIVKTSPGTESAGSGAEVNFVTDNDETMVGALAKLTYKAGKVSAFSHTSFIILGRELLNEDLTEVLDYFVRNKTINSSALLLFAEEKAADELEKTKDVELSVGIGLQKVFLFKEIEGDGEMTTVLNFLKHCKGNSKTATASTLKLMKNEDGKMSTNSASKDEKSSEESQSSSSGESSNGSSGGDSQESGTSSGSDYQYFEALSSIVCCVDGKYVGKLETTDEIIGYMLTKDESKSEDLSIENVSAGRLDNAKIGIRINHKHVNKKIRFENGIPCLDVIVYVNNAEIEDLRNKSMIGELSEEEYNKIKKSIKEDVSNKVSKCFEKSQQLNADIFGAYDLAIKFHYLHTTRLYNGLNEFLKDLKLNVQVEVVRLDY